jgi:hypothetical protein
VRGRNYPEYTPQPYYALLFKDLGGHQVRDCLRWTWVTERAAEVRAGRALFIPE